MPGTPPSDSTAVAKVRSAGRAAASALLRLEAAETIEQAYDAWAELRVEHAAFLLRCADERRKLDEGGGFLLGAVRAAAGGGSGPAVRPEEGSALAHQDGLSAFLRETEAKLAATREALEAELASETAQYAAAFSRIREAVLQRISAVGAKVKPVVRLVLRPLAGGRTILHVARPGPDESVLLFAALNGGRAPTRYGYLFDDATDDVTREPPSLYADADESLPTGASADAEVIRPDAAALEAVIRSDRAFLPVKGHLPVPVGDELYRLLQRGPVLEVEKRDGAHFRSILAREEGERFAGHLLRLKLEGRLELELSTE